MYKKYPTSFPIYGMWGSRKTSWDGPANTHKQTFTFGISVSFAELAEDEVSVDEESSDLL